MTPQELAMFLWPQGILAVPTYEGKKPITAYADWRINKPDKDAYIALWEHWALNDPQILTGLVYGEGHAVEAIDVDAKNDPSRRIVGDFEAELLDFAPDLFAKLYIEETPSGGRHYFYKTKEIRAKRILAHIIDPDQPLAEQLDHPKFKPLIEFQGANALCRCWPTEDFVPVRGDMLNLSVLEPHEVNLLEHIAALFETRPEETVRDIPRAVRVSGDTPGNDYANRITLPEVCDMFERHGWSYKQRGHRIYLRRPGAKTKNWDADIKNGLFMSFSSSVSDFVTGEGYNFFRCYTILEHGGDFKAAARALREQGFGGETTVSLTNNQHLQQNGAQDAPVADEDALWDEIRSSRLFLSDPPKGVNFTLFWKGDDEAMKVGETYNVAAPSMSIAIKGTPKSRKTSLVTAIVASALCGEERCGFKFNFGGGDIVWCDTEQPSYWAFQTMRRILIQAGMDECPPNLHFYPIRKYKSAKQRLAAVRLIAQKHTNMALLVIDGIKDLMVDFNDNKEADAVVSEFLALSESKERQVMVIHVIHVNKGDKNARGHLGAELSNKCDIVIDVRLSEWNDDISEVKFELTRDRKPPAFDFLALEENIPHIEGRPKPRFDYSIGSGSKASSHHFPTSEPPYQINNRIETDDGETISIEAELLGISQDEL